jgi:hypothetical protein
MNRYLFLFVDGAERRRAFAVTVVGIVVCSFIFPIWAVTFAAVMSFASILLRPSAKTIELKKRSKPAQLGPTAVAADERHENIERRR